MSNDYSIRVPNLSLSTSMTNSITTNRALYAKQLELISSGKKYIKRSENPAETDEASRINNNLIENDQWRENVQMVQGWESATEARLSTITDIAQRLNELEVQANDGTLSDADRESIAEEVDGLLESMVTEANSTYIGTPLFGGTDTDTVPYSLTRDADGQITAVTYEGGTSKRSVQTSEGTTAAYGLLGEGTGGVFEFESVEGDPPVTNTVNVFDNIIAFRDALAAGDTPSSTISERITKTVDHMANKVIENAVSQQKFNRLEENMDVTEQSSMERLSDVEDLDVAEAATVLAQLETSLEASLQLLTRMNSMSIMNYI